MTRLLILAAALACASTPAWGQDSAPTVTVTLTGYQLPGPGTGGSVDFDWSVTIPGGDPWVTVNYLEARCSNQAIDEEGWEGAELAATLQVIHGRLDGSCTIDIAALQATRLEEGLPFHLALKCEYNNSHSAGLWSPLSNLILISPPMTPPADIDDLMDVAAESTWHSLTLRFTEPADTVALDLRASTQPFDEASFDQVSPIPGLAATGPGNRTFVVKDRNPDQDYYFMIKAADNLGNWNGASNGGVAVQGRTRQAPPEAPAGSTSQCGLSSDLRAAGIAMLALALALLGTARTA